uniref:CSN8/PSMD8/EIF3K domain-containing protein n=1 Tax=Arcella intermedia TaxID=1963864 RepID=A0A6B2LHZ6_9EUKA
MDSCDRFEESSIPIFESYIKSLVKQKKWDMESVLALVKLYQFYPEKANENVLALTLALCLLHVEEQAFSLALYMVPEKMQSLGSISKLIALSECLESAQYAEFWTKLPEVKAVTSQIDYFAEPVQQFISGVLERTYGSAPKNFVSASLNLKNKPLIEWIKSHKWVEEGNLVRFTAKNQPAGKVTDGTVNLDYLAQMLTALR